jgi:membrane peptidoglycan carboxypeptidase
MKKSLVILSIAFLAVAVGVGSLIGASFRKASEAIRRSSGSNHPELLRRAVLAAEAPRNAGEASITNQFAKDYSYDRSSRRMTALIRELLLSAAIDTCYSSDDILSAYMNSVYMGKGIAGLPAAARAYLGKSPHDLDAAECALLAGLIRSPTYYSPIQHLDRAVQRRNSVLKRMLETGAISSQTFESAKRRSVRVAVGASAAPTATPSSTRAR